MQAALSKVEVDRDSFMGSAITLSQPTLHFLDQAGFDYYTFTNHITHLTQTFVRLLLEMRVLEVNIIYFFVTDFYLPVYSSFCMLVTQAAYRLY